MCSYIKEKKNRIWKISKSTFVLLVFHDILSMIKKSICFQCFSVIFCLTSPIAINRIRDTAVLPAWACCGAAQEGMSVAFF